ncbi:MAG: hypothetical protein J5552_08755 [Prevotella sp.]|nr:hypothetical protein [Prevotella sp.]
MFFLLCACSSSDEDDDNDNGLVTSSSTFMAQEKPSWQVDQSANQQSPQWTSPDPSQYENKMIVMVRLQEELVPFSTDDDLMAVIVGNECRALSTRDGNAQKVYFVLNVHGNAADISEDFVLCYYSGGLKQLFMRRAPDNSYFNERTLGIDSDFSPEFTEGSTKYPIKTKLTVNLGLMDNRSIGTEQDVVGVFVGDECRGVGKVGKPFTVFSNSSGEQGELRFYSSAEKGVFTANKKLTLTGDPQTITFEF